MSEVTLLYVHGASIGYGRYGVHLAESLREQGVDVYDKLDDPTFDSSMEHLNRGRKSKLTNVVCWISVPTHARGWWKGQYPVISTMWEATRLPESFRETLHEFAHVIVPSFQNLELFSRYHSNVSYVPLGVDPAQWHYVPRQAPTSEFRFLIGGSGPRKGTDLAYKAFRKVFKTWPKDGPVPKLIMKSPRPEDFYGDRIERIGGRIESEAEIALYASAHCYLQPSRGEGFGLQPLQAIAQGLPTILTNAHGHESFAHLGHTVKASLKPSDYFIYGDAGEWWEPDLNELCERMEWVYLNYEEAAADAAVCAQEVAEKFTWQNTAARFREVLGDELDKPYSGLQEWFSPDIKRYRLVTNRDWACDIAGVSYQFTRGKEYWEVADVKRILFEAGILDPVCCGDDDNGLTSAQLEALEDYSGAHSYCHTCGQRLGSRPTRAEELMPA